MENGRTLFVARSMAVLVSISKSGCSITALTRISSTYPSRMAQWTYSTLRAGFFVLHPAISISSVFLRRVCVCVCIGGGVATHRCANPACPVCINPTLSRYSQLFMFS